MMQQYQTLISQSDYPLFGIVSTVIGIFLLSYFFIYQIAYKSYERSLKTQIGLSLFSSAFLGIGITLLFLTVGIYL